MTVDQLTAWLDVSETTVRRSLPPDAFFKIGLVKKSLRSGGGYQYRSTLREHLVEEFPEGDVEQLQQMVLKEK